MFECTAPWTDKAFKNALGLFSHYPIILGGSRISLGSFITHASPPLSHDQTESFKLIKSEITKSVLATPEPLLPYTLEIDASYYTMLEL